MNFSRTNLLNCFVFCASLLLSTYRLKVELVRFMHFFFHKKNAHCYLIPHSFANVLYLSTCMLGNCSCFYCRLLTFLKNKFLQINHQDHYQSVKQFGSRSRRTFCGLHPGSNCLRKTIGRRRNSPLACKEL